jgi:quercetin dioxygenase-like cupin family protein
MTAFFLNKTKMEKFQFFEQGTLETEYAIGKITMNKVSDMFTSKDQLTELKAYYVTFIDGARTRLHYHQSDQILIAMEGEGRVEIVRKIQWADKGGAELIVDESTNFTKGETVLIPGRKLHWHGAVPGSKGKFAHIAILRNTPTVWL